MNKIDLLLFVAFIPIAHTLYMWCEIMIKELIKNDRLDEKEEQETKEKDKEA